MLRPKLVHSRHDLVRHPGPGVLEPRLTRARSGASTRRRLRSRTFETGTTNIFSGTIRPARHDPIPTRTWLASTSLTLAPGSARGRCGRLDLLAAGRRHHLVVGKGRDRHRLEADIYGQQQPREGRWPAGSGGADRVEVVRRLQAERPAASSREGAEVGAAAEPLSEVAGQRPDVRAGAALHVQHRGGALRVRAVPLDQLEAVDRHRPRGELERLTLSGHPVGPTPPDLHGTERGRALVDRTAEAAQRLQDGLARGRRPIAGDELAVPIVGGRAGAEADRGAVGLVVAHVVFDDARPESQGRRAARRTRRDRACRRARRGECRSGDGSGRPCRGRSGRQVSPGRGRRQRHPPWRGRSRSSRLRPACLYQLDCSGQDRTARLRRRETIRWPRRPERARPHRTCRSAPSRPRHRAFGR